MKKLFSILILCSTIISFLQSQNITIDTTLATKNYKQGKEYYLEMKLDTAFSLFQKASDTYLKHKLWYKYLYSETEKAGCKNLKYEFEGAFKIIEDAFLKTEKKVTRKSPAYAYALFVKGKIFHNQSIIDSVLLYYNKALKIREEIYKSNPNHPDLAQSYYYLNKVYFSLFDFKKAIFYNDKALKIDKTIYKEDDFHTINTLNDRGLIELYSMNHRKAENIFEHTLKLTTNKLGAYNFENIYPLSYLGLVYQDLGDYDKAIENQEKVLSLTTKNFGPDHYYCGTAYQNLADAYNHKQENEIAIEYAIKAITIFTKVFGEKNKNVADAIGNLGVTYTDMKNFEKGKNKLNKALEIFKEIKGEESYDVSRMYQSIGALYQEAGEYEKSKEYNELSLKIKKKINKEDHYSIGMLYINMAVSETALKNYSKSLEYFKKAKSIFIKNYGYKSVNMAILYNDMGDAYRLSGDISNSINHFQKAIYFNHKSFSDTLNIYSFPPAFGYTSWHDLFISMLKKAEIFTNYSSHFKGISKRKCFDIALNHYKVCDTLINNAKIFASSKEDKLLITSKTSVIYKEIVNTCMELVKMSTNEADKISYLNQAFIYSEKNKASLLLEALSGAEAQKFAGIPDSLLKKEKNLQIDISYYKKLISESTDSLDEINYFNKLFKLNRNYDTLISIFENDYPKFHNLKYSNSKLKVTDLQKSLNMKTALISYFISDSILYAYYISKKEYFIEQINITSDFFKKIENFRNNISDASLLQDAYANKDNKIVLEYKKDAYDLYNILFPNKIKKQLKGNIFSKIKNLIIIPDGQLSTIPFEALISENYVTVWTSWENTNYFSEMPFLVKDYNISYSYSANLFFQTIPKTNDKPEFKEISDWLALAPVFDNDNISGTNLRTRKLIEKNSIDKSGNIDTRAWLRNGSYISPLPGSKEETENIFEIFEKNNKKAILKTHQFANEEYVKSGALKNFKFLHIATHGMVNEDKPELSCILLAQDTTSTEDNILFSGEIYNLELNADLTVLSACETGLGKIAEGEGVIGLTRALLYAGSKNIIVSLWQVSDESTKQLMVNFYKNIFKYKKDGYSEHLSKSKNKLIKEGKYAHPFFWSPFILIGK